jgi:hypothetical protein
VRRPSWPTDRAAGFAALSASANELALLSCDINHLTRLLRQGDVRAARAYADRHENLDADVRAHLDLAAAALAELAPAAARGLHSSRTAPNTSRLAAARRPARQSTTTVSMRW